MRKYEMLKWRARDFLITNNEKNKQNAGKVHQKAYFTNFYPHCCCKPFKQLKDSRPYPPAF